MSDMLTLPLQSGPVIGRERETVTRVLPVDMALGNLQR